MEELLSSPISRDQSNIVRLIRRLACHHRAPRPSSLGLCFPATRAPFARHLLIGRAMRRKRSGGTAPLILSSVLHPRVDALSNLNGVRLSRDPRVAGSTWIKGIRRPSDLPIKPPSRPDPDLWLCPPLPPRLSDHYRRSPCPAPPPLTPLLLTTRVPLIFNGPLSLPLSLSPSLPLRRCLPYATTLLPEFTAIKYFPRMPAERGGFGTPDD
jgi:hypothetical protein